MRSMRLIGVAVLAVLVLAAVAAASAAAQEAPEIGRCVAKSGGKYSNDTCTKLATKASQEKYEWEPGAVKNKFTGTGGVATLETVSKVKVTCKAEASSGEFTSPKTVGHVHVTFTGCESDGFKCSTTGAAAGEVVVNPLAGEIHWENKAKKKTAQDLVPETGELFVVFSCGPATAEVKGSVLVNIKAGKMEKKVVEKFSGKGGKQKPEDYETASGEKVKDVLISKIGATPFEQAGQTVTNTQEDEEALEVNWFV
jgi:hypothetical protein